MYFLTDPKTAAMFVETLNIRTHRESPVLELGPAAAHVGGVLPHQLRVVTHPAAALLAGPVNIGLIIAINTYYVETVPSMPIAILNVKQYHYSCCMLQ